MVVNTFLEDLSCDFLQNGWRATPPKKYPYTFYLPNRGAGKKGRAAAQISLESISRMSLRRSGGEGRRCFLRRPGATEIRKGQLRGKDPLPCVRIDAAPDVSSSPTSSFGVGLSPRSENGSVGYLLRPRPVHALPGKQLWDMFWVHSPADALDTILDLVAISPFAPWGSLGLDRGGGLFWH